MSKYLFDIEKSWNYQFFIKDFSKTVGLRDILSASVMSQDVYYSTLGSKSTIRWLKRSMPVRLVWAVCVGSKKFWQVGWGQTEQEGHRLAITNFSPFVKRDSIQRENILVSLGRHYTFLVLIFGESVCVTQELRFNWMSTILYFDKHHHLGIWD